jgi:hypothetical protein
MKQPAVRTPLQLCRALFNVLVGHLFSSTCTFYNAWISWFPPLLPAFVIQQICLWHECHLIYIGPQLSTHMTFIKRESSLTSSPSETQIFITVTLMTFYNIVMLQLIRGRKNRSDTIAFCMLQFVFIPSFPLTLYQNEERTKKCKYYVYLFSEGGSLGRAREW